MELTAGTRCKSTVCDTEVVVVRPPDGAMTLACGGADMVPIGADVVARGAIDATLAGRTQLGKRYADEDSGIEVLCTKAGEGTLTLNGVPLGLKGAKPLPSSD